MLEHVLSYKADYIIFTLSLVVWCILHSAMISMRAVAFLKMLCKENFRFYRIVYNIFASMTFLAILTYLYYMPQLMLFKWRGFFLVLPAAMYVLAALLLYSGAQRYDLFQFMGIRQVRDHSSHKSLNASGALEIKGVLKVTRHPWYLAVILLLWGQHLSLKVLMFNVILTTYIFIGTYLEEKKLVKEFGDLYRKYQKEVSMLFPWNYIRTRIHL